jgi:hypothetical protein
VAFPNPLLPGFHPDPSIVRVDGSYLLVTSTLEHLPGLPVYRSDDLVHWEQIGNVATRPEQVDVGMVGSGMGVWAPTIRHRDGTFYVIVTIAGPRGCVLFTADDPAGPWSDGLPVEGITGIDPDLAWDDDGTAYVTYSGLDLSGDTIGHEGIRQVRFDVDTATATEPPRSLWSGTGLQFPEAPHLHRREGHWYLVIAEGGTERGHAVSVARGPGPEGPFEPHPANPILSARSTGRAVQNTGHADLVETPDGGSAFVLLGMRPVGAARAYSPLGRETFVSRVRWEDGWPVAEPVEPAPGPGVDEHVAFDDPADLDDPGWLGVRDLPGSFARVVDGRLVVDGGTPLEAMWPHFLGRRQRHHGMTASVVVDASGGTGGLACRSDEQHWFGLVVQGRTVTATAHLAGVAQRWEAEVATDEVELRIEATIPEGLDAFAFGADRVRLWAGEHQLVELDGRYWSAEVCAPFAGRLVGLFATEGTVAFRDFRYRGDDTPG